MTNTIDTTEERVNTIVQETTETQKTEMSKAEICTYGNRSNCRNVGSRFITYFILP